MPTLLQKCKTIGLSTIFFLFFCFLLQNCSKMDENLPEAVIVSLQLSGISSQKSSIVPASKTVEITVPYGTSLKSLTPILEITAGANIVPASKIPQDFSQPVYYVLTSAEGKKTVYKISVTTLKQPVPEIINFDKSEIEAGENIIIRGKYFGNFQGAVQAYLVNVKNEELLISSRLIDSTQIQLTISKTVLPQSYAIKINVNGNVVLSNGKVNIQYPSPEITSLSKKNILQGDTLFVKGDFISDNYSYTLQLNDGKNQGSSPVQKTGKGAFYSILSKSISAGNYAVQILNETTQKKGKSQAFTIQLYDVTKPFVSGIVSPSTSYKSGDKLIFKTLNFESFPSRFFQIQLSNGKEVLFQNAIYNKTTNTLTLDLPTTLKVGNYSIVITLINTSNQEYAIEMDEILVLK
jgi:hypothetical protein